MRVPLPKIRELIEAIKALIKGPYTSKFPKEPHIPHPNFRGQPQFNPNKCVGCLACEIVCPVNAIAHSDKANGDGTATRTMIHYTDTCIFCGQCEANCIANHEGIKLSNEWELAFFDRAKAFETIEKSLELCERCGETVACTDHLRLIFEKLGTLSYANPSLYLTSLRELGVINDNLLAVCDDRGRADRTKILCARCRRSTAITTA